MKKYKNKISKIATTYHDRAVMSSFRGDERECPCCNRPVKMTTSIEHDSQDYSKDLSVCVSCYSDIVKQWRKNTPKKIFPAI